MYVNKCIKCGREFETKNPKRVICPDCLYPDKKMMVSADNTGSDTPSSPAPARSQDQQARSSYSTENRPQFYSSYSSGGDDNSQRPYRPQRQYNNQGGYSRDNRGYNNFIRESKLPYSRYVSDPYNKDFDSFTL